MENTLSQVHERPRPELLVLDLDGTIIDVQLDRLLDAVCAAFSLATNDRMKLKSLYHAENLHLAVPGLRPESLYKRIGDYLRDTPEPKPKLLPGVERVIKEAKSAGSTISVATARGGSRHEVEEVLKEIGLQHLITDVLLPAEFTGRFVDKTVMLNAAAKVARIKPERACMVGDSTIDIVSAKRARFGQSIAVLSGGISRSRLSESSPDCIVPSLGDVVFVSPRETLRSWAA